MLVKKRPHAKALNNPGHIIQRALKFSLQDILREQTYIYFHDIAQIEDLQNFFNKDLSMTTLLQKIGMFNIHPTFKGGYAVVTVIKIILIIRKSHKFSSCDLSMLVKR